MKLFLSSSIWSNTYQSVRPLFFSTFIRWSNISFWLTMCLRSISMSLMRRLKSVQQNLSNSLNNTMPFSSLSISQKTLLTSFDLRLRSKCLLKFSCKLCKVRQPTFLLSSAQKASETDKVSRIRFQICLNILKFCTLSSI